MEETYNEYANKNFKLLFINPEERARIVEENITAIIQDYNNDIPDIKREIAKFGDGHEFYDDTSILDLICFINSKECVNDREELMRYMKSFDFVRNVEIPDVDKGSPIKFSKVDTNNGSIEFISISDLIMQSNVYSENNEQDELNRYCSSVSSIKTRNTNCHEFSIWALKILSEYFGMDTNLVTGKVCYYIPQNKYLHSWLELNLAGKECVLDSTKNIIIDKQSYYRLLHVDEREVCSKIKSKDIIDDELKYGEFIKELDYKTYLTTRDEIIKDLEKNEQLFDKVDNNSAEER